MHSKCKFTQITLKNTQSIFCCFSGIFWNYIYLYLQIFIVRNGRCTYQRTPPFRHKNYPEWMMLILPGQRTNQITPSKEVPAQNVLMNIILTSVSVSIVGSSFLGHCRIIITRVQFVRMTEYPISSSLQVVVLIQTFINKFQVTCYVNTFINVLKIFLLQR